MFAIIELGGKQHIIKEKDVLRVERLDAKENEEFKADKVLLISNGSVKIGTPYLNGASATLKVLKQGRGDKVTVFKMKAKKRYKRLRGHRQHFTEVSVLKING